MQYNVMADTNDDGNVYESGFDNSGSPDKENDVERVGLKFDKLALNDKKTCEEMIYTADKDGDNQLMIAIIHSMDELAIKMINEASAINLLDARNYDYGHTAMHLCVMMKRYKVLEELLEKGASRTIVDKKGNTPLHIACKMNDFWSIYLLTTRNDKYGGVTQDINALNFHGHSFLHLLTKNGADQHSIGYLIRGCGADINVKDGLSGRTILHYAGENNNLELVKYLIEMEADIEALTYGNETPLQVTAGRHNGEVVQAFFCAGADYSVLEGLLEESEESILNE